MEVFKYLHQMFATKNALIKQISLFSIIGIMIILFNNYISGLINLIFDNFYINTPTDKNIIRASFAAAVFIFLYLTGYSFKFFGQTAKNGEISMPEFSLEPFKAFVKMLPLFLAWAFYYFIIISFVCLMMFSNPKLIYYYVFYSIMLCLLPFVFIIFIQFAATFKYEKKFFNPFYLFKILDKTLGDVIFLSVEILIPTFLLVGSVYALFLYSSNIQSENLLFGIRYFGICLSAYLLTNLSYIYNIGLAKITNRKIIRE